MSFDLPHIPLVSAFIEDDSRLLIIFGFVLLLVLIGRVFRHQRDKMWHDTARLTLEKGQPLPERPYFGRHGYRCGPWSPWWEMRRGLVLIAVSVGLYLALPEHSRDWVAIPACIGAVYLLFGLLGHFQDKKPDDPRDPPRQA